MTEVAPRCPYCASIVKVRATFWSRIGLKPARAYCPACTRECEGRDARMMGASFHHWVELFRGRLTEALAAAPILSEPAMVRALGNPHKDETQMITSPDELLRVCLHHQRLPVSEMARGREAALDVAPLRNETTAAVEAVAVLGTSSTESGSKEFEQIIARTGERHYVVYTYPAAHGAEPRVKRAVHALTSAPKIATQPQAVAGFRAARAGGAIAHGANGKH
jgi:hypothetical protein